MWGCFLIYSDGKMEAPETEEGEEEEQAEPDEIWEGVEREEQTGIGPPTDDPIQERLL